MPADPDLPAPADPDVPEPVPNVPEPVPHDHAVLDRIVDGSTAVLLVGPDEREVHVPADALPDGATDGTWLVLDLDDDTPRIIGPDPERTAQRTADLEDRLSHLRATRSRGRFQRDDGSSVPRDEPDDDRR